MSIYQKLTTEEYIVSFGSGLLACVVAACWTTVLYQLFGNEPFYPVIYYGWYPDADFTIVKMIVFFISAAICFAYMRTYFHPYALICFIVIFGVSCIYLPELVSLYNQKYAESQIESATGVVSRIHIKGDNLLESILTATKRHSHDKSYAVIQLTDSNKFLIHNSDVISLLHKGDAVSIKMRKGRLGLHYPIEMEFTAAGMDYRYTFTMLYYQPHSYRPVTLNLDPTLNESILKSAHAYRLG
jgi:hypothetical protein